MGQEEGADDVCRECEFQTLRAFLALVRQKAGVVDGVVIGASREHAHHADDRPSVKANGVIETLPARQEVTG